MSLPPPPPGLDINENIGPSLNAANITLRVISLVFIGLRFLARRVGNIPLWWDDWIILVAGILVIPALYLEVTMTNEGVGRHIWWLLQNDPSQLPDMSKRLYADEMLYVPFIALCKLSILCLYLRLFGISKVFAKVCYAQMVLVVIWAVITQFLFIFQCNPIWVGWDPTRSGGTCFKFADLFIGTNTVNVIMDFAILFTPWYSIWTLKLSIRKKLLVTGMLILGGGEVIVSILRVVELSRLNFMDATWDDAASLIWSMIEITVAAICVCLPTLAPLLPRAWTGQMGRSSRYRKSKYSDGNYPISGNSNNSYGRMGNDSKALGASHGTSKIQAPEDYDLEDWNSSRAIHRTTEFTVQDHPHGYPPRHNESL